MVLATRPSSHSGPQSNPTTQRLSSSSQRLLPSNTLASAAPSAAPTRANTQAQAGTTTDGQPSLQDTTATDLRCGIDPGDPLTAKGRIRKRLRDKNLFDPDDPDRFRYKSYHIRRAFDLYGHLPTIINDGIKRRAKESAGEVASIQVVQSDRNYETFQLITNHLEGLNDEILRLKRNPKAFRALVRKIREAADQARNNDTANLKRDIACMLTHDGSSVLTVMMKGKKASSKHDRGFDNDVMGRHLCPISLDWDDPVIRAEIRDGKHAILASDWPRLLYADCECDVDDLESGLGRNMALVRVVKYLFTGRSAAFSETAGGRTTRSGNAELAGMKEISPRVVAYAACMLRYAISNEESWASIDKEFNMEEFYWHVVSIFDESEEFGRDLLTWWNLKVFGTSIETSLKPEVTSATATLSLLRMQRQAKRAAQQVLGDITNHSGASQDHEDTPDSEDADAEPSVFKSPALGCSQSDDGENESVIAPSPKSHHEPEDDASSSVEANAQRSGQMRYGQPVRTGPVCPFPANPGANSPSGYRTYPDAHRIQQPRADTAAAYYPAIPGYNVPPTMMYRPIHYAPMGPPPPPWSQLYTGANAEKASASSTEH